MRLASGRDVGSVERGAPFLPAAPRGRGGESRWCVVASTGEGRRAELCDEPVDRFGGGWLQVIRRCLYSGWEERIARCVFVNKNHRRYRASSRQGGTVPVSPVVSPFPGAPLPSARLLRTRRTRESLMARPKKRTAATRPHVVAFRLNDAERARLAAEAAAAGLAPNDVARAKVTGARVLRTPLVAGARQPPAESPAMFELRQQLTRVGVNLNQIARRLHMTGEHEPDELKNACRELDAMLRRIAGNAPALIAEKAT